MSGRQKLISRVIAAFAAMAALSLSAETSHADTFEWKLLPAAPTPEMCTIDNVDEGCWEWVDLMANPNTQGCMASRAAIAVVDRYAVCWGPKGIQITNPRRPLRITSRQLAMAQSCTGQGKSYVWDGGGDGGCTSTPPELITRVRQDIRARTPRSG